jgi:hypothetical protein
MSHFLTHLAARTLATPMTRSTGNGSHHWAMPMLVQPRISAVGFEPAQRSNVSEAAPVRETSLRERSIESVRTQRAMPESPPLVNVDRGQLRPPLPIAHLPRWSKPLEPQTTTDGRSSATPSSSPPVTPNLAPEIPPSLVSHQSVVSVPIVQDEVVHSEQAPVSRAAQSLELPMSVELPTTPITSVNLLSSPEESNELSSVILPSRNAPQAIESSSLAAAPILPTSESRRESQNREVRTQVIESSSLAAAPILPTSESSREVQNREVRTDEVLATPNLQSPAIAHSSIAPSQPGRSLVKPIEIPVNDAIAVAMPRPATVVPQTAMPQAVMPQMPRSQFTQRGREIAPPPALPTIQVTIGRIEIRAITPPVTPPMPSRPATTPARMSLDAYLRSRSGG